MDDLQPPLSRLPLSQLPLAFPHQPSLTAADFIPHEGARLALEVIAAMPAWPQHRLVLWGGPGAGKTHLLSIWAAETGAARLAGPRLAKPFWPYRPVAIDDADRIPSEQTLLHVVNAAAEGHCPLLLTFSRPPGRSAIRLPDLASRLRASMAVEIGPPGDDGFETLMAKLLSERQLAVPVPVQRWLLTHLPRTSHAIREAVARLDYAAMAAQMGVSRAFAAQCLSDLLVNDPVLEDPR